MTADNPTPPEANPENPHDPESSCSPDFVEPDPFDPVEAHHRSFESDLDYVQAEMEWIEARCRRIAAQLDLFRVSGPRRRRDGTELDSGSLVDQRAHYLARETSLRDELDARIEAHRSSSVPELALDKLAQTYHLDDLERLTVLLAVAPCISRPFDDLYSALDNENLSCGLSVEAIFTFAEIPFGQRVQRRALFGRSGRLVRHDLISNIFSTRYVGPKDLLTSEVTLGSRTFAYVLGQEDGFDELSELTSVEEAKATFEQVVIRSEDRRRILSIVDRHDQYLARRRDWGFDETIGYGRAALMLFHGPAGTGKTLTAHAVAHHMGKRVLNVDIPTFVEHREATRFLPGLFREARMQNAILLFDECESLFESRHRGNGLMTQLLTEIERFDGVAILATNLPEILDPALDRRILIRVHFPEPDKDTRREIWRKLLPAKAPVTADVDLDGLADRFDMSGGYIKNAVLMAVAETVHGQCDAITMESLERAAKDQLRRPRDGESRRPVSKM